MHTLKHSMDQSSDPCSGNHLVLTFVLFLHIFCLFLFSQTFPLWERKDKSQLNFNQVFWIFLGRFPWNVGVQWHANVRKENTVHDSRAFTPQTSCIMENESGKTSKYITNNLSVGELIPEVTALMDNSLLYFNEEITHFEEWKLK